MDGQYFLGFISMMSGEYVSATIDNKGAFLPRCWISKVHCPFTGILLLFYAYRVVVDFVMFGFVCRVFIWFSTESIF